MNIFENIKTAVNEAIDAESKKYNPMFEDLVKIVRCKNCKYFTVNDKFPQYGHCERFVTSIRESAYCSYGAKKENEKNEI